MYKKYHIVNSLNDALGIKNRHPRTTRVIAGGTDLMVELEKGQHLEIDEIIDLSRIAGLDQIQLDDKNQIHIGPTVTHSGCLKSDLIKKHARCLYQACENVGSPQIRNRGTVAGNLATASPANDTISALMALDASVEIRTANESRVIKIKNFFTGVRKTVLQPDELITDIFFSKPSDIEHSFFIKNALRNAQAISVLNVSVLIGVSQNKISVVRIALGSVAPTVIRAQRAEEFLIGKIADDEIFTKAGEIAANEANPISDIRASGQYRRIMVAVHVKRALVGAIQGFNVEDVDPVLLWGREERANAPLLGNSLELDHDSPISLLVNGRSLQVKGAFHKNLLDMLRDNALLSGTKEGCGEGECGACTIFMDGIAVMACLVPVPRAHLTHITTKEGIAPEKELHKVQQAFIDEGAVQCGYCTPGFIMSSVKLLEEKPHPSRDEILTGISGNLCRCTGYYKIISAIEKAAKR